ncbi:hypothetical protein [Kocuria palustris]|uniref:hypothetical protein n=1 Tax=Kocuria palustris TaxID=71999 RepID=UPI0011A5FF65|nr:hypothetical protein [Kocuria palustris]
MTDALTGRALLTAALTFLLVLSVLAGVGAYASNVYTQCRSADVGSFVSDVQAFHSEEGCELAGSPYGR